MNEVLGRNYNPVSFPFILEELLYGLTAKYVCETQIPFLYQLKSQLFLAATLPFSS